MSRPVCLRARASAGYRVEVVAWTWASLPEMSWTLAPDAGLGALPSARASAPETAVVASPGGVVPTDAAKTGADMPSSTKESPPSAPRNLRCSPSASVIVVVSPCSSPNATSSPSDRPPDRPSWSSTGPPVEPPSSRFRRRRPQTLFIVSIEGSGTHGLPCAILMPCEPSRPHRSPVLLPPAHVALRTLSPSPEKPAASSGSSLLGPRPRP